MDPSLTGEEYEAVQAAVGEVTRRRVDGTGRTLNSLLHAWAGLVAEVEVGYGWCAAEFSHDRWCRTTLGQVWPLLPARVREMRQPMLDALDDRFRAATVAWPEQELRVAPWWTLRIPRRLAPESEEGVSDHGWPWGWDMMPFPRPDEVEIVDQACEPGV
ncbi:hypothetical protein [Streptacidiphilus jiangxiensis]|uniref:Uncharacterized protein n=1 Tax=Streptacidiphilus jiangxiensis TaxID=235985 RepID=A0A1H7QRC3_STRJI|nr:hypothetical protein [Streptacidiphilus jiangxiensis]SEL50175.1 hypothetical protein SAMN05414137_109158 [Streptacidiphilus jiangxiensis]